MTLPGLLVSHECPQCGAPVLLEEADRLLACGSCRARLAVWGGSFLRYWIPPPAAAGDELVLAPYWRVRGVDCALRAEPFRVVERAVDLTLVALGDPCLPPTLGLRPQAVRLRFAAPSTPAFFLEPEWGVGEVLTRAGNLARVGDALAGEAAALHRELVAETASLVYAPLLFRGNRVVDALLGRELAACAGRAEGLLGRLDRERGWELRFLPAICPECGGDLAGDRRSAVLLCGTCRTGYEASGGGLRRVPCAVADLGEGAVGLPFWRLSVGLGALGLETGADLARFANLPRGVVSGDGGAPLAFWVPAFSFHPRLFLRLARQVTLLQPQCSAAEAPAGMRLAPVEITARQGLAAVLVVLAQIGVPKKRVFPLIPSTEVEPRSADLVFLPFAVRGADLVQPRMGFAVPAAALRHS